MLGTSMDLSIGGLWQHRKLAVESSYFFFFGSPAGAGMYWDLIL